MVKNVSGIYQIKNIVNNTIYIGSAEFIRERWVNHLSLLKQGKHHSIHLQNSWNKYGKENFQISILEECSKNELIFKEQFYLNKLLKADQYILKKSKYFLTKGLNIKPVANPGFFGKHSEQSILKMLKKKGRPVMAISPDGHILGTYLSVYFATIAHNINDHVIRKCSQNRSLNKSNEIGFIYEDLYTSNYIPKKFIIHNKGKKGPPAQNRKPVYIYTLYGEFLKKYDSHLEASKALNMTIAGFHKKLNKVHIKNMSENSALYRVFTVKNPSVIKQLKLEYLKIKQATHRKGELKINRLDHKLVGYSNSIKEASIILKTAPQAVQAVLNGRRKQLKGYHISYAN